jgi:type I restriction enzyme S subunit
LGEIGTFKKGKGIKKDYVLQEGLPCVRYGELYNHHHEYIKKFNSFISPETAKESHRINKGDVLFAGSGETKEEIGKCAAFIDDLEAYAGGDVIILSPHRDNPLFLGFLLNHQIVTKQKAQKAQGDAVVHIYPSGLSEITIPLPLTKAEQTAIATALSDTDALIASLEKLIAKKEDIKKGAMQELLTGKKRLPGFSGEWIRKKISDFTYVTAGGTPSTFIDDFWGGNIKWMSSGELSQKIIFDVEGRITELGLKNSSTHLIPAHSVLIGLAGQGKTRGTVAMNMVDLCTNQSIAAILPSKEVDSEYLYHNLDSRYVELRKLSTGEGGRGGLNLRIINKIEIPLPPTKAEQTAIAKVLSDMDAEIEALKEKLHKYRLIKQGMMEELLTGKTRLV